MTKLLELRRLKRRILISAIAVCFCLMSGVTYAWYVSQSTVSNIFEAGELDTVVMENFTPPTNWEPGATTDDVVQVVNTGTIDAFVRVELEPNISFDCYNVDENGNYIMEAVPTAAVQPTDFDVAQHYAQAKNKAIDNLAASYNSANTDKYVLYSNVSSLGITFTGADGQPITETTSWNGNNLPLGVVLYVKTNTGNTTVPDSSAEATIEIGENYDFLGYYVYKNTDNTYTYYKISVEPDNGKLGGEYANSTDFIYEYSTEGTTVTATLLSKVKFMLYKVTAYGFGDDVKAKYGENYTELDRENLNKIITINYYKAPATSTEETTAAADNFDTANWYRNDGVRAATATANDTVYYYYRHVLQSGQSTTPLVDSVTFNDSFSIALANGKTIDSDYVTNTRFNLRVNELSTQAIYEAAAAAYGPYDTVTITDKLFTLNTDNTTYDYSAYKSKVITGQRDGSSVSQ